MDSYNNSWSDHEYSEDRHDLDDEYEDDDYNYIDNSDMQYSNRNLYIRLNENRIPFEERRNKLDKSISILIRRFPELKKIQTENLMQTIMEEVFAEGFLMQMYIRNLTFQTENGYENRILAIRPEKHEEGGFLNDYLPRGISLLFKGHMTGYEFVIDSVHETSDSGCLDFEVDVEARPFHTNIPAGYKDRFLDEILSNAESLTEHTEERLKEWENYLRWRKELARRQVHGCKYYKVTFDEDTKRLVFWLLCEGQDEFRTFRRYLYRDIQVFNNDYSNNKWKFSLRNESRDRKRKFDKSIELGKCRGVVEEYYINGAPDSVEIQKDEQNCSAEYEEEIQDYIACDDYEYDKEEELDFFSEFEHPYVVKVAFDLNRNDSDEILEKNMDDDEVNEYIRENILGNYYRDGFLALSAVGDFVLINRFENAIAQLKRDESYSPNLAMWLFNVQRARLPEYDYEENISKWLNKKIEQNEDQKKAVYKMLNAPDLCLIQGPPGTGKTTVIAEAIYQFVRNGNRVLVTSQSNDAVDNALDRLAKTPEIRAIRLGQNGKRKRKNEDLAQHKFSEDEALKYFYNSLSSQVSSTWLDKWNNMDKIGEEYATDIRDARLFQKDIEELSILLERVTRECEDRKRERKRLVDELEAAREYNEDLANEHIQFETFCDFYDKHEEDIFYLSEEQLRIIEGSINSVVEELKENGIYLASGTFNVDLLGTKTENDFLVYAIKAYWNLRELTNKMKKTSVSESSSAEMSILERKLAELQDKMGEADDDEILQLSLQFRNVKRKIDALKDSSSTISLTNVEKSILSKEFKERIDQSGSLDNEANKLSIQLDEFDAALQASITSIKKYLNGKSEKDTATVNEQVEIVNSKYEELKAKRDELENNLEDKRNTLIRLSEKYKLGTTDVDTIIKHIESLSATNDKNLKNERIVRDDWETTLKAFKSRIDDKNAFKYDKEYYQKIYINACNVVGISCTDNMRNLTDNGYNDFDVVIIDEVSKATPPELLIPLMKARKAILVGDHRQLPPMFNEHEKSYNELIKTQEDIPDEIRDLMTTENFSRFRNMVTSSLFKNYFENADKSIKHSLFTQYRMHSDIMDIINRFYEQHLNKGLSDDEENMTKNHGLTIKGIDGSSFIRPDRHAYWIDSSLLPSGKKLYETRPEGSSSAENILERHIIVELLKKMANYYRDKGFNKENPKSIGIISFYQLQVNGLREAFRNEKKKFNFSSLSVDINTVDRFQGKEKQIIITSLVRNPVKVHRSEGSHVAAFERINVAFSRAQEMLVIVGSRDMYEKQPVKLPNMDAVGERTVYVYQNIIEDLNRKACFMSCSKIINSNIEKEILTDYEKEYGGGK